LDDLRAASFANRVASSDLVLPSFQASTLNGALCGVMSGGWCSCTGEAFSNTATAFSCLPHALTPAPAHAARPHTSPTDYHPSQGWQPLPHHLSNDALWARMRAEAKADADAEPTLASFLYSSILGHSSFEKALDFILANKLASPTLYSTQLVKIIEDVYHAEPSIVDAALADMQVRVLKGVECASHAADEAWCRTASKQVCH
jgi:hypothetical protein